MGRAPAADKKDACDVFVCLFFVTLWNDEVCDNGNATKQCNLQNNYGAIPCRGRFAVVHLYSRFLLTQDFPLGANLYQKLAFFAILGL